MKVAVSRVHFPITTLGPGNRLGVWFQGCSIRCPGCISVDTWDPGPGAVDLGDLLATIDKFASKADGLTISGGEPFDQPNCLAAVLRHWRKRSEQSVIVFTGREFDELSVWLSENPDLIDAVITGPFRADLPQTLAMRGSDNQRLHVLSDVGREILQYDKRLGPEDRRLDIMFDEDGHAWMAGIPARGDVGRLRKTLAAAGHETVMSADRKVLSE